MSLPFVTFWIGGMAASGANVLCELKHRTLGFHAEVARECYPIRFAVLLFVMVVFWPASLVLIYRGAGRELDDDDDQAEDEA